VLLDPQTTFSQPLKQTTPLSLQNRVAYSYAKVIIHILHILLAGKWDALDLLGDPESWSATPAFVSTIGHVVEAANSVENLLELDPDTQFMPFFLGIYIYFKAAYL